MAESSAWFPPLVALAVCAASVTGWIRLARAKAIEDAPGGRRVHSQPTPRGGGIGIFVAMTVLFALSRLGMTPSGQGALTPGLALGLAGFAAVGLLDDLKPMGAAAKLVGQIAAGLLCSRAFLMIHADINFLFAVGLLFAWLAMVNLWNFMDGSNGLVALQSLLIAAAISLWPDAPRETRWLAGGLAAACVGFLPFNFPKASVFLGDVGSHFLGAIVFLLLLSCWLDGTLSWAQAAILPSAFLIDGGLTLLRRAWHRRPVWRAHREHLYQYAIRRGASHTVVALAYGAWTLVAIGLAASPLAATPARAAGTLTGVLVAGTLCHDILRRRWLRRPAKEMKA